MIIISLSVAGSLCAQLDYERSPVLYSKSEPANRVSRLQQLMAAGDVRLEWDNQHGYLKSLLQALQIDADSQVLVFSKTSLQASKISPKSPRAIYFREDVYVGWVPDGEMIELTAVDAKLGAVFYSLKQDHKAPELNREISRCVTCHASTHTRRVPGHIVRSVYCDLSGQPILNLGSFITTDRSPLAERWGGWYVTGKHGQQAHLGNQTFSQSDTPVADASQGANVIDLKDRFDTSRYLSPYSDIVSLLVLEHQTSVQNVLTAACHAGRIAEAESASINELLQRPKAYVSDSLKQRFDQIAKSVVDALLMQEAIELSEEISSSSTFERSFQTQGPVDLDGRSLRNLDLRKRAWRYPCSYLIYSEAFQQLPNPVLQRVYHQLYEVLSASSTTDDYAHISIAERKEILAILAATGIDLKSLASQGSAND